MRPRTLAIVTAATAAFLATPAIASADFTSALANNTVTLTGTADRDAIAIGTNGTNLTHNLPVTPATADKLNSATDWDPSQAGDQVAPADGSISFVINAGDGNDAIAFDPAAKTKGATIDGGAGNDNIIGTAVADTINGGDGDDVITPGKNAGGTFDVTKGGNGNDQIIWNNGDGSDQTDGEAGANQQFVNGDVTQGDVMTVKPSDNNHVLFNRTNLVTFSVDMVNVAKITIDGAGGDDTISGDTGLNGKILLDLRGGQGKDTITGGDGPDLIQGGDDVDTLSGGGGDDRIIGDRGNDVMSGGDGDDALVWNNGDGTDKTDGDNGYDTTEVNGAPGAETFTLKPGDNGRSRFDRTSAGAFGMDMNTEVLALNAFGGDDTFTESPNTPILAVVDGGAGNDTLTGSSANDTFYGGSGNDTLTSGGGADVLDGNEGDDVFNARDNASTNIRGGAGNDKATTDLATVDPTNGVESVDATAPVVTPPPVVLKANAPTISAPAKVVGGKLVFKLTCAAGGLDCAGHFQVVTKSAVKVGSLKLIPVVADGKYSIKAGSSQTLKLKPVAGYKQLGKAKKLALVANARSTNGAASVAKSFTIKL